MSNGHEPESANADPDKTVIGEFPKDFSVVAGNNKGGSEPCMENVLTNKINDNLFIPPLLRVTVRSRSSLLGNDSCLLKG